MIVSTRKRFYLYSPVFIKLLDFVRTVSPHTRSIPPPFPPRLAPLRKIVGAWTLQK